MGNAFGGNMRYFLLITFLAFTGSAQAQFFDRDEGEGLRRHGRVLCHCWRDKERSELWREQQLERRRLRRIEEEDHSLWHRVRQEEYRAVRHRVRFQTWRHHEREEGYNDGWRRREKEDGYGKWRSPERNAAYLGWWRPEGGWRDSELRDGPRRCRPPMHAAGDADVRTESARNKAIKSWQEQVINEHGERFLNFDAAYVLDEHCDPARVGEERVIDLKRCVVTAAPCLTPRETDRGRGEEQREEERK